jgi:hypothetical protein
MIGDYLREAAVLVLVFIPIDLWKNKDITGLNLLEVGVLSLIILGFGMFCEWIALLMKRVQNRLEGV